MENPDRLTFQIECIVPSDKTPQEAVAWIQKFFDFYHPSFEARVLLDGKPIKTK